MPGPGSFLARWQSLLDSTLITPAEETGGSVRKGGSGSVLKASAEEPDAGLTGEESAANAAAATAAGEQGGGWAFSAGDKSGSDTANAAPDSEKLAKSVAQDRSGNQQGTKRDDGDGDVFEEAHEMLDELGLDEDDKVAAPDTTAIWQSLAEPFRKVLAERSCTW